MSNNIIQLNENLIKTELKILVKQSVKGCCQRSFANS